MVPIGEGKQKIYGGFEQARRRDSHSGCGCLAFVQDRGWFRELRGGFIEAANASGYVARLPIVA